MYIIQWADNQVEWYLDREWDLVRNCNNLHNRLSEIKSELLIFPEEFIGITDYRASITWQHFNILKKVEPVFVSTWYDSDKDAEVFYELEWEIIWQGDFGTKFIKSYLMFI